VTSVVLPAIRKDGAYIKDEETSKSDDDLMILRMQVMHRKLNRLMPQAERMDPESAPQDSEVRGRLP